MPQFKNTCPKCGGTLDYFQTTKKYHCPTHGIVEPLNEETYNKIVKGLREQFGIKEV